jgi:competence protein ComEA
MRMFFRDYLCFSRSERNGTLVLATLMVLVFVFPYIYNGLRGPAVYRADNEYFSQVNALIMANDSIRKETGQFVSQSPFPQRSDTVSLIHPCTEFNSPDPYSRILEINSADTAMLMQIKGIGEVLSRRIIRYRDILGGYADLQQLEEVYGIDEERLTEILPYLRADTTKLIKIQVNSDGFRVMLRHPYLDFQQVSQIFRMRDNNLIRSPVNLLQLPAFSETDIERLSPYLSYE